jgi:hypothetical protein
MHAFQATPRQGSPSQTAQKLSRPLPCNSQVSSWINARILPANLGKRARETVGFLLHNGC